MKTKEHYDCGEDIPDNAQNGEECTNCGHAIAALNSNPWLSSWGYIPWKKSMAVRNVTKIGE